MLTFQEALTKVEAFILDLKFEEGPKGLFDPILYTLSLGGKRIRPVLALMAANLYKEDISDVIKPAVGLEVFHNFTLLHDDLMDNAPKRRGQLPVYKKWTPNVALLSGDAMMIAAYQLIAQVELNNLSATLELFSTTAMEVCAGQQMDMEFETQMNVEKDSYIEMIRLKTAVLLACSLKMGALLAGAPEKDQSLLYNFGINIGLAFQLQDDLLDVYGDVKTFGKEIGGDILCNKKTFLLITALNKANSQQSEKLNIWLSSKDSNPQTKIKAVTEIYDEIGVKQLTQELIVYYYDQAMSCLSNLSITEEKTKKIRDLSDRLMKRNS